MYKDTTFNFYPVNDFDLIRENIRNGKLDVAKRLLLDGNTTSVRQENVDEYIENERTFLKVIDESFQYSAESDGVEITARQAILKGILYGYKSDAEEMGYNPDIWHNPFAKDVIVDWAKSFYPGDISDLELVFESLVVHGLLKEVHPETFAQPYFVCSYDSEFLMELENGEELVHTYREEYEFPQSSEYDSTWSTAGICKGQGSQSANWPFYTCIGTSCFHFRNGSEECSHGLKFNPVLVKAYRERKQL